MNKKLCIDNLLIHFKIQELVCPHVFEIYGDQSWQFMDEKILMTLYTLRNDIFSLPMVINNYNSGGPFTQRGLRCGFCPIVQDKVKQKTLYLSGHIFGQAIDFDVLHFSGDRARQMIWLKEELLQYPIRMELNINWVHIDTFNNLHGVRIYTY
jgi:hypothetical protein